MPNNFLSEEHRGMLENDSGISSEVIADRGYRTVKTQNELRSLGFSGAQAKVPGLLVPGCGVSGDSGLPQYRSDDPRIRDGKPVKYETPARSRMALDVHPSVRHLLSNPKIDLWITEGVKKGDALVSHGLAAVALLGVWNWRGTNEDGGTTALADWEYVALKSRKVYIVFDSDVMSKPGVRGALGRLKAFLELRGAKVAIVYLPPGEGEEKVGVDDYLVAGHSVDELESLAVNELKKVDEDSRPTFSDAPYESTESGLVYWKLTRTGSVPVQLTNFQALIVAEVEEDDGLEIQRTFEIETSISGRDSKFFVPSSQFANMSWVVEHLGAQGVLRAGFGLKEHTRAAIQLLSGEVPKRILYRHTGWRKLNGKLVYLHAGSAIGSEGAVENIEVSLPDVLDGFVLPDPPNGEVLTEAVKASLTFLDVAPDPVVMPIFAYLYRIVLGDVDHGTHIEGATSVGKTELTAIAQAHFGSRLNSRNLPGSWSSTANALEELCFVAKDALVAIDDFAPTGTSADVQRLHREADRLFRSLGNRSARRRLRSDASLRAPRPPRCGVISTGEDVPKGQSLKARLSVVSVSEDDINWEVLSLLQRDAENGCFAQAMSGYIQWLTPRYEALRSEFKTRVAEMRNLSGGTGMHRRTSDIAAQQMVSVGYFFDFAEEVGAISNDAKEELKQLACEALRELSEYQADYQSDNDEAQRFISLISSAISTGRVHVADPEGGPPDDSGSWGWRQTVTTSREQEHYVEPWRPQGQQIGWLEGDDLYLDPDSAFAEVQRLAKQQDDSIPISQATLGRRLKEQGLLASTGGRGKKKNTRVRRTLQGVRRSVFHTKAGFLHAQKGAQGAQSTADASTSAPSAGHLLQDVMMPTGQGAQPASPPSRDSEKIGHLGHLEIQEEDESVDPWDNYFDSEVNDESG